MLPLECPDRIQIAFDDHRLGLSQLVDRHVDLGRAPGPSQRWRQDADPGGVGTGRGRLH